MEIIINAYVNRNGAYYESGGIVNGTQRILNNHQNKYWQQGNSHSNLGINTDETVIHETIPQALYVGRIPTHFGHFIMEGLARLCNVVHFNVPIIGYITDGFLPEGILPTPHKEIRWVINTLTNEKFYELKEDEVYSVNKLLVPSLPYHLSHSCSEPWRMQSLIGKLVKTAKEENPEISNIENYYLRRYENEEVNDKVNSDPTESISKQIAKVSLSDNLFGTMGSNTHLSIFAKADAKTNWIHRGSSKETVRNQIICDLIKTYNNH